MLTAKNTQRLLILSAVLALVACADMPQTSKGFAPETPGLQMNALIDVTH